MFQQFNLPPPSLQFTYQKKKKKSFDQVVLGATKVVKIGILTSIEKRAYKIEWEDWIEILRIYGI